MVWEREMLEKCKLKKKLKTIIGKLERKKKILKLERLQFFFFFFFPLSFKLKRLTQNSKTKLKRFWVESDSGTK